MEAIEPIAQSISTYGLYAIIAILCVVVVFLYKKIGVLEKEVRAMLDAKAEESAKHATENANHAAEMARSQAQTLEVLKDNTKAFNDFQAVLTELKTTIQFSMERKP